MKAKKALKRKMPHRRDNEQYWNEAQFQKLIAAPPGKLYSRGPLPWRLLGYMLDASPEIDIIRRLVGKRLMDSAHLEAAQRDLERMLLVLHKAGYVRLEPEPPEEAEEREKGSREQEGERAGELGDAVRQIGCLCPFSAFALPLFRLPRSRLRSPPPASLPPRAGASHGGTAEAGAVPQREPAVRHVPGEPVGNRRPQGADPGLRERLGFSRARWRGTSACRNRSSCRRDPWPRCGSISSCCNSGWQRSRNWCRSPRRKKSPGSPAAATTPSRTKNPSGCSRWPKSCGGCSTTSTRAFSTSAPGPCGPPASC